MREALSSQSQRQSASIPDYSIDDTPVRKGLAAHAQSLVGRIPEHSMDDTPMRDAYHQGMLSSFDSRSQSSISGVAPLDLTVDTPMRMHSQITQSAHNISIDTPMRQQQNYRGYPEQYGSPQRQLSMEDTPRAVLINVGQSEHSVTVMAELRKDLANQPSPSVA